MATAADIDQLRLLIDDRNAAEFSDDYLAELLDAGSTMNATAATLWRVKAARYVKLVHVKEGSSTRNLGDMHAHALAMAKVYGDDPGGDEETPITGRAGTREITRA